MHAPYHLVVQVSDNGVAGLHIVGSKNFTFEATIGDECYGNRCPLEGEGRVGSLDGQQLMEVIVERSTLVKFQDMKVLSVNGERARFPCQYGTVCNHHGRCNTASRVLGRTPTDYLNEIVASWLDMWDRLNNNQLFYS